MEKLKTRRRFDENGKEILPTTRSSSTRQEKEIQKALGGRRTSNSGATRYGAKGDIVLEDWTIEAKTVQKPQKGFTIKKEWIEKLRQESLYNGKKYEALAIQFGPGEENFYLISENIFKELIEK